MFNFVKLINFLLFHILVGQPVNSFTELIILLKKKQIAAFRELNTSQSV